MKEQYYDALIIGTGLAGLFSAINIDSKYKVIVLSKTKIQNSNSSLAQGGIACEYNDNASLHEEHIKDTLRAGSYLNNKEAVKN